MSYYRRIALIFQMNHVQLCAGAVPCSRNIEWVKNRVQSLLNGTGLEEEHLKIDIRPTTLPLLDESYRCDKCDKNHFEEDYPYFGGPQLPTLLSKVVVGWQRCKMTTRQRIVSFELE